MANNKYAGYTPTPSKEKFEMGNRLDRVNPYEFRKGMDYELTKMGCSRLAESTLEEREKSTEAVLKNLDEHGAYYSALIQFEGGMNHGSKITETNFKKFLESFTLGDGMTEVTKEIKDDKMTEPKYDSKEYTKEFKTDMLKEAIKNQIKTVLEAKKEKEMSDDEKDKKAKKGQGKIEKKTAALDKEIEKLEKEREKNKTKLQPALNKYKDGKMTADEYRKKSKELVSRNKEIVARVKEIEKEKEKIALKEKADRREVAKTMMERDTHMELLNIVKEAGVSLKEGSEGVKMYYEIAKVAYQEGFMAGLKK